MNGLRNDRAERQIPADDHVMIERFFNRVTDANAYFEDCFPQQPSSESLRFYSKTRTAAVSVAELVGRAMAVAGVLWLFSLFLGFIYF